jgi:N-acetylmuramoyl-L-alanine amidase
MLRLRPPAEVRQTVSGFLLRDGPPGADRPAPQHLDLPTRAAGRDVVLLALQAPAQDRQRGQAKHGRDREQKTAVGDHRHCRIGRVDAVDGLTDDIYADSRRLAIQLRDAYGRITGLPRSTYIGENGLDKRTDLGGLRLSDVPKVFVETGNMRNPKDAGRLESSRFRGRIAKAIFAGLRRFLVAD